MPKDLPYFKFGVSEWITGAITLESDSVQGLFINICAHYWFKSGKLSLSEIKRRLSKSKPKDFDQLIKSGILKVQDDFIRIDFLDAQLQERAALSETNSRNGKLGGRRSEEKAIAMPTQSEQKAKTHIREKKREEESKVDYTAAQAIELEVYPSFEDFWQLGLPKMDKERAAKYWKKIPQKEREAIMEYVPEYVASTDDKKYLKSAATFLNQKAWKNEIINRKSAISIASAAVGELTNPLATIERLSSYTD